jgi:hypothetical protein
VSILTDLMEKKITFSQAVTEGAQWFEKDVLGESSAAAQQDAASALSNFKQAASNAIALGDTAIGGMLIIGGKAVEVAANTTIAGIIGPNAAAELTPGLDASIDDGVAALKAEIDAVAASARAKLTTPKAS